MAIFLNASQQRMGVQTNLTIHGEVRDIEERIMIAAAAGQLSVSITDTVMTDATPTTQAQEYYQVWQNLVTDRVLTNQMTIVVEYFEDLGYSITRKRNTSTNTTFYWEILW